MARWLGIDIGPTTVRAALLQSGLRRPRVLAMVQERLSDHETASSALRVATAGMRADSCAVAMDGRQGFLRRVDLPAAAHKDLTSVLSYEVESTLPFELDDAVMDHRRLRPLASIDQPGQLPIFAAVAYTEKVRDAIGLVRRGLGLEPARVGLGPLPLANLALVVAAWRRAEPVAVVALEEQHTDVLVMVAGEPRFARTLSRGTSGLPAQAPALGRELRQTLAAWRAGGGARVDTVHLCGSGRALGGVDAFVREALDVLPADLPRLGLDGLGAGREADLPSFAKAIGLALGLSRHATDLNLRQGPLEAQHGYQFLRDKTPLLAGLGAAVLVSFGFSVFAQERAIERDRGGLETELAAATKAQLGQETRDPERARELLDAAIAGKSDDPIPALDAFDVLVAISERIPKDITHDIAELDYNRGKTSIKGIVSTIDEAHTIAAKMEGHECFHDVSITRTTRLTNQDKQKYTLEFEVECRRAKIAAKKAVAGKPASSSAGKNDTGKGAAP